jgi:hypothetical protein
MRITDMRQVTIYPTTFLTIFSRFRIASRDIPRDFHQQVRGHLQCIRDFQS